MTPIFLITVGGANLSGLSGVGQILSASITDEADNKADKVDVTYVYRGFVPSAGDSLSAAFGYQETGLTNMGTFVLDEPQITGSKSAGYQVKLSASSIDTGGPAKEERSKSYIKKPVKDIVNEVAGRCGWQASVADKVGSIQIDQIQQTQESDLHFLKRLAGKVGASFKVTSGRLIFAEKRQGLATSGIALPLLRFGGSDVIDFTWKAPKRKEFKQVQAHWHDRAKAERQTETASGGKGDKVKTLPHAYPNKAEASKACEAAAKDAGASGETASATLIGNPSLLAEGHIMLPPLVPQIGGLWSIRRAVHAITKSGGYTTKVELERPS